MNERPAPEQAPAPEAPEVLEVVGFDLGHGETSFAVAAVRRSAQPELLDLHGEKSQITALARHPRHGVLVGERALRMPGSESFEICFKRRPDGDPRFERNLKDFAQACHQHLLDTRQVRGGESTRFYVGCPSGWSADDRRRYAELLTDAGIAHLLAVPESRAALLHAKESGKVTAGELRQSVLVVDIGSSTTDFTLVEFGRDSQLDFGADLGAALIDRALYQDVLFHRSDGEELGGLLDRHPLFRARCEIACRKAKEEYFRNPDLYEGEDGTTVEGFERLQDVGIFEVKVDGAVMERVLRQPLAALGGSSWESSFRELMQRARRECDELGRSPAAVLMTGGASRMGFAQKICDEVFGLERRRLDTEPEYCIARGLARWGRVDQRTRSFLDAIEKFCAADIPAVMRPHEARLPAAVAGPLADALLQRAVRAGLADWRSGAVKRLADLEDHVSGLAADWLQAPEGRAAIAAACAEWFDPVQRELNRRVDDICIEYHLPTGTLAPRVEFRADLPEMPSFQGLASVDALGDLGGLLVACVVASLLGGGGLALVMTGPVGLLVGFVIGLIPGQFVRQKVKEQIARIDLPLLARRPAMSDERIEEACARTRPELVRAIEDQIHSSDPQFAAMLESVSRQLRTELRERADEQRAWID